MCNQLKTLPLKINAGLSHTGKEYWKRTKIDACIADIVESLQSGGIDMLASCCGHGKTEGRIDLVDGRILFITENGYLDGLA